MLRRVSGLLRARGLAGLRRCSGLRASPHQARIDRSREVLTSLMSELESINASADDVRAVELARRHLDELFVLCVVGEFNSGKSSLINRLIDQPLLKEGVTPTTDRVHVISSNPSLELEAPTYAAPPHPPPATQRSTAGWLQHVHLVDTPGTNAVVEGHREITDAIVPRSDMLLFVTSVERPFTESEQQFLSQVQPWRKKVLVVLNKFDLLISPEDQQEAPRSPPPVTRPQVVEFVTRAAEKALGAEPPVLVCSAKADPPGVTKLRE